MQTQTLSGRKGVGVQLFSTSHWPLYLRGGALVPIVQGAG